MLFYAIDIARARVRTAHSGQKRNDNQFNWPTERFVRAPAQIGGRRLPSPLAQRAIPLNRRQSRPEVVNGPAAMMSRSLRSSGGSARRRWATIIGDLAGRRNFPLSSGPLMSHPAARSSGPHVTSWANFRPHGSR